MRMVAIACVLAFAGVRGEVLPQLPESAFAGTEVSTNVPCAAIFFGVREFGVSLDFTGTASNCVQVAFGHDADGDGSLSPAETGLVLGWRAGSYFIEDAVGGDRVAAAAEGAMGGARRLELHVTVGADSRVRSALAVGDGSPRFAALLAAAPGWLCGADWNLLRVTRRGVDAPGEIVCVTGDRHSMKVIVR